MKCILCNGENLELITKLNKDSLCLLYKKALNINISNLITANINYFNCKDCDLKFFVDENGNIPTGDNDFYNSLNKLDWYYFSEKSEYHYAKKFINKDSKVLEVGCGKGAFVKFMPKEARDNYVGLEFSTQAKIMAQKDGIKIENISIEEYAKDNQNRFDIACSFQVLEHISNPFSFIQSQIKCLNGGGRLIIGIPSEDSFLQYCVNGILNMPPHHISRFSDKTLNKIAEIFNLDLLDLYHEKIQKEHFDFYKTTIWAKRILPTPLIDTGLKRKLVNRFGRLVKPFMKIPDDEYGHTVVAVYKIKPNS